MRIIAGSWRGRTIQAPPSEKTRPTADRTRQAVFDMLTHAPWGLPWPECAVLDAFAGTGALGLESLSRGARHCVFFETDRSALQSLRANIAALGAGPRATIMSDSTRPPPAPTGGACRMVFLDPPYGMGLIPRCLAALGQAGWLTADALIVAETSRNEALPEMDGTLLSDRLHGAARITIWRSAAPH